MLQQGRDGHVVDSARFAREDDCWEAEVGLEALPRLSDAVQGMEGRLRVRVVGSVEEGKLFLTTAISGMVWVRCQRCLGDLAFPLQLSSRLMLVEEGQAWPDEELADDRFDAIAADLHLDLLALAEDEVLLALPIAPRHEDCVVPYHDEHSGSASPFSVLEKLRRH